MRELSEKLKTVLSLALVGANETFVNSATFEQEMQDIQDVTQWLREQGFSV